MKISTKAKYGLRALTYITRENRCCSIKEISDNQHIPHDYLAKIFSKLKKNNIVKVKHGSAGGYLLADQPDKISIGKIIKSLEGTTNLVNCTEINNCHQQNCMAANIWRKFQEKINKSLDSLTLADSL